MSNKPRIFRYTRGEYSCDVSVVNEETLVFDNLKFPPETPSEVVEKLMDYAERQALKLLQDKRERVWSNS